MPSTGVLGTDSSYQPRIYFGEYSPDYSIVGGRRDPAPRAGQAPGQRGGTPSTPSRATGGPNVGNIFNKLMYAMKFQSTDLLFSDGVNLESGIPSTGVLGTDSSYQPRIYFGEYSPDYSIVGG
ncbi:hypothetical protein CTI14_50250, partial [Methylobacterium radiotolerans]